MEAPSFNYGEYQYEAMTFVVVFLFTGLINYAIIVHILGDATMKTTDFEQHGIKRKKAFVDDKLARKVLNELFPVMQCVSNNDSNVVNYVVCSRKRLIDNVVRYKDLYLPIALDFSIDTDLDGLHIKGYQAFYTFHLSIDNDQLQSFVFDNNRKSDFNVKTLQEFLGEEAERFTILYDSYYNKESSPMEFRQHGLKVTSIEHEPIREVSFNCKFKYRNTTSTFSFNIYSNALGYKQDVDRVEELSYQLKPMEGIIEGQFTTLDFWKTIKDNPSMIAEPFRVAIQKHYNVDEYVIPYFDSHIELFDFYNEEQTRIQEVSEMLKI